MKATRLKAGVNAIDHEALARAVAPIVLSMLATALGATQAPYSTRRGHEPPEYVGRAKPWRELAPKIPGAVRVGRWWSVPRDAYARWLAAQSSGPAEAAEAAIPTETPQRAWSPADELPALGLRRSGGAR